MCVGGGENSDCSRKNYIPHYIAIASKNRIVDACVLSLLKLDLITSDFDGN